MCSPLLSNYDDLNFFVITIMMKQLNEHNITRLTPSKLQLNFDCKH